MPEDAAIPNVPTPVVDPSVVAGVQQLFARYARAADDHDYDAWSALFCADALFVFGADECRGRERIRTWLSDRLGGITGFHSIVNVALDVGPDGR
ncbi:MAG TPA: nuclear transport factor 2 family protein, partial [Acidimicrobiales bacterium]|nr:nuclear transport factor 2 family protein [Acidimicrobiales bacterium]